MVTKLRPFLVLAACLVQAGCGTLYVAQAAKGQLQLMQARRPIEKLLRDPKTDPALRRRLETVREARAFAVRELGLPNNRSYTSYADLRREYVTWSVVATPEFSVTAREWCFPIVGCVAYRGYFRESAAQKFATRLRLRGYDTVVGGVPAYSTLGRFDDPILSTMMSYGDDELAGIMFHELSHQVVYIPDDTAFNEAFAVTVERAGLARWLAARGRAESLEQHLRRRALQAEGMAIVRRHREALQALYASGLPPEQMRARKAEVFTRLVAEVRARDARAGIQSGLAQALDGPPNNARLASVATYYDCVPGFERLLSRQQGDLPRFYAAVRGLAKLPRDARRAQLCTEAADAVLSPRGDPEKTQ
jgi:predicted aminopeptidase